MLERETRRAVRSEQGLGSSCSIWITSRKFNDTYGHDAGDTVLRETAASLLRSVRAEDIVCRFGGEEFLVILPQASLEVSQARAERIRSKLRRVDGSAPGPTARVVTASLGVAELPRHGTSPKQLIEAADAAFYRAKKEGRDRVVVATQPNRKSSGWVSRNLAATSLPEAPKALRPQGVSLDSRFM